MTNGEYYEGIGRRKASTARVRVYPGGTGAVIVNEMPGEEYFDRVGDFDRVVQPLRVTGSEVSLNVTVKVSGGGVTGQSDAVRQGLARALLKYDPELRRQLRAHKMLTRDSRVKERKKPGLKRARKAPTYTKR
ncbi:MAG: 30S ribosomal protein S9 [Anaerolineales bacterium]